jgi:hypothetical protein
MKMTINEFIETIDEDELYKLQFDITNGSAGLKTLVQEKIKKVENLPKKVCAVCGEELVDKEGVFSLIFTHDQLKKKASFCAIDCMEFFISKIKKASESNGSSVEKSSDSLRSSHGSISDINHNLSHDLSHVEDDKVGGDNYPH